MRYWLKLLGKSDWMLENFWWSQRPGLTQFVRFSERRDPTGTIRQGDKLVFYATGWQVFFAVATVTSDEARREPGLGEEQWPLALDIRIERKVGQLANAPAISTLGLTKDQDNDKAHGSFVELRHDQYEKALNLLV